MLLTKYLTSFFEGCWTLCGVVVNVVVHPYFKSVADRRLGNAKSAGKLAIVWKKMRKFCAK